MKKFAVLQGSRVCPRVREDGPGDRGTYLGAMPVRKVSPRPGHRRWRTDGRKMCLEDTTEQEVPRKDGL